MRCKGRRKRAKRNRGKKKEERGEQKAREDETRDVAHYFVSSSLSLDACISHSAFYLALSLPRTSNCKVANIFFLSDVRDKRVTHSQVATEVYELRVTKKCQKPNCKMQAMEGCRMQVA